MNILSICDGMSCAQIALRELGIKYNSYYASEIDKFAIKQTQLNFPDTIQLGDIEKWREWDIDWAGIDFIFAGTPCTGFSKAGKGLAFNDSQSRLFWVFVEILNHARKFNTDVIFLFENVKMKAEWLLIISEALGIYPVLINSALVSAQNRERYYWSNIRIKQETIFNDILPTTAIPQPENMGILLRDILEDDVSEKYFLRGKTLERIMSENPTINPDKSYCISKKNNTTGYGNSGTMTVVSVRGENRKNQNKSSIIQLNPSKKRGNKTKRHDRMIYEINAKSPSLVVGNMHDSQKILKQEIIRRLTPTECARLQTIPEWYKWDCSDSQQYKMLGNGFTIKVITHILNYLPNKFKQ